MSYLELLQLAAPEAIVVITALAVLTIGLVTGRRSVGATVSVAGPRNAADTPKDFASRPPASTPAGVCFLVAALGLAVAAGAVVGLPLHATLFHGMLVISPLNSLFKIVSLVLALSPCCSRVASFRCRTKANISPSFCSLRSGCCFSSAARNSS